MKGRGKKKEEEEEEKTSWKNCREAFIPIDSKEFSVFFFFFTASIISNSPRGWNFAFPQNKRPFVFSQCLN